MNPYLEKHLKSRDKNLKYDFLPAMSEIIEKPANPICSIILYMVIGLIAVAVLWACFAKLDIVVNATGAVNCGDNTTNVHAYVEGIIEEISRRDGDYVKEGDVICKFSAKTIERNLAASKQNYEILETQKRVFAELYERYKRGDYAKMELNAEEYGEHLRYAEAVILNHNLFAESIEKSDAATAKVLKEKQLLEVIQSMNSIDAQLETVKNQLNAYEEELEKYIITAPSTGLLAMNNELSVGKVVAEGEQLGTIIPQNARYEFVSYVSSAEINQISEADEVRIRLASYHDTASEYVKGHIRSIGDIPLTIDGKGTCYAVTIEMDTAPDKIKTGMEGSIDIIIGQRTVMDYFLEPFKKGLGNSLKER